jgi:tetratricopeptide (TPR) repeat protein
MRRRCLAAVVASNIFFVCGPQIANAQTAVNKCRASLGDEAIAACDEAIRQHPSTAWLYSRRGYAWKYKRDYEKAIADYNKAITLNPKDADVYSDRGTAWLESRDYQKAVADFRQAFKLQPNSSTRLDLQNALEGSGFDLLKKGDYDRAILDFNEGTKLAPIFVPYYIGRALAWHRKGNFDKAIADNSQAMNLDPGNQEATRNLIVSPGVV